MRRPILIATLGLLLALAAPAAASSRTYTFRSGPVSVKGFSVRQGYLPAPHPGIDGAVTHMSVDVVDADNRPMPIRRIMLHHLVFTNLARRDATCSRFRAWDTKTIFQPAPERFYAVGEERQKLELPSGYGYALGRNDPWALYYMLMNHRQVNDTVFIRYRVTVDTAPVVHVKPYWLDVDNCEQDPIFNVPGGGAKGSTDTRNWDYTMPESGRIVAGGGHVHGGAKDLVLSKPDCGQTIARSRPTWGEPDHPFYKVRPVLHEPGPIDMTRFTSARGVPVARGERLRLSARYDDQFPHVRVMGIMVVFVAPDASLTRRCARLPGDVHSSPLVAGRHAPVRYRIPLTGIDDAGRAVPISAPPGKLRRLASGATIRVGDDFFSRPNVRVRRGGRLTWNFSTATPHNLTLANGPVGIGSRNLTDGRRYSVRFSRPGTYRFFCALHPVEMTERVVVP